jgi:ubiquinone/menaquinone biosynthesis C-methylase UbiE
MDFAGDIAELQRRIAETPEGNDRRMAVFKALDVRPGQAVLDIGCGGGHLLREFSSATGDAGRVIGLELSAPQLAAAAEFCSGLGNVEFAEGSATAMPFGDGEFDALSSIQTYEYVADVDVALAEARRVLKPGAKAAIISVLWDHWRFSGPDRALNDEIHEVWRAHCHHQMLPFEMHRRLSDNGFGGVVQKPIAFINTSLHENAFALWASRTLAFFGKSHGMDEKDVDTWLAQLEDANREGRMGFTSVPVLTVATAV